MGEREQTRVALAILARDTRYQIAEILMHADGVSPWNGAIDAQVDIVLRAALRQARDAALEEAARVVETQDNVYTNSVPGVWAQVDAPARKTFAAAIRALKEVKP